MSDETQARAEWVSALMDGELHGAEFARAMDHLEDSASARAAWDTYHLVGEVLRRGKFAAQPHDAAFLERLRAELSSTAPAADALRRERASATITVVPTTSANDHWWRRVAGLAVVTAVSVFAWQAALWVAPGSSFDSAPTLAQQPAPSLLASSSAPLDSPDGGAPVMLRDPQLDALLAAHRQHGGMTALQMPAGFLRNATFNEASR